MLEMAGLPTWGLACCQCGGHGQRIRQKLLAADGLPIGDYLVLRPGRNWPDAQDLARLGYPLFVKPARGGSSIGVSRVTEPADLARRSPWPVGMTPR